MAMPERGYAADRLDPSVANYALTLTDQHAGVNGKFITEAFNDFTVEFLVKPVVEHEIDVESTTGFGGTYGQKYVIFPDYAGDNSDGNAGMGVSVGTNGVSVYEHAEGYMPAILVWASPTPLTAWTHVAVVYTNKLPSLYINGVLVRTAGAASPRNKIYPTYQFPGGIFGTQGGGQMDEVRIWGVARTGAQIAANMNTEVAANSANLVGYWPMNEGSGTTLTDVSGHGRNINLTDGGYANGNWTSMGTAALAAKAAYRYAFNGKEKDQDIGEDDYDYGMRIHDARLGRFLSVDPLTIQYPELTPYQFASNTPIQAIDLDGLEKFYYARTTDNKGNTVLTPLRSEPLIESKQVLAAYSGGRSAMSDPQTVYKTVKEVNQRQDYIVYSPIERPITRAAVVTWETYQGIATYDSYEAAANAKDEDFKMQTGDFLAHYAVQGLINVGEEYKEGNIPGSKRFGNNPPSIKAQINPRHKLNSNALARSGKTQSVTLAPSQTLSADLDSYNAGNFSKSKSGNVLINGTNTF